MASTSRSKYFNKIPKSISTSYSNPKTYLKSSQFHTFRLRNFHKTCRCQQTKSLVPVTRATTNLPLDTTKRIIESDQLFSNVRDQTMNAVDTCGGNRVTVGDVSSKTGININEAEKALQALAADTNGFMEVSDEGDILYVFPTDYRSTLVAKSLGLRIQSLVNKVKSIASYVYRVTFGATLIASIVIVSTAIIVIIVLAAVAGLTEGGGADIGDPSWFFQGAWHILDISSPGFCWYWEPQYHNARHEQKQSHQRMNFMELIFSFVFGDRGGQGKDSEEERWKLIGQYIVSKGGVVTAEEIVPYLDVQVNGMMDIDSYILPVLLRFEGKPKVDEEGNILYRFPSLQRTGTEKNETLGLQNEKFFVEKKREFSKTSKSERVLIVGLGAFNLLGVICLGTLLKSVVVATIPNGFISFVSAIFPLLQIYATSFFVIPMARWLFTWKTNSENEKRNRLRQKYAQALQSPDLSLRLKLLNAQAMSQRTFIGQDRIVYTTERDLVVQDYDTKEWDQRLSNLS